MYLVYIILINYSNIEQKNVTMKVNIDYKNRLRLLEEEEITCIYKNKTGENLYIFDCSKSVKGFVSNIIYVDNSLKLNGESLPNYDELPISKSDITDSPNYPISPLYILKNWNLTKSDINSFTIEGENSLINLTSKDSYLFFKMDNKIKNISCEIENEDNNKYKVICISESRYIFDLSNNNYIAIKDLQKSLKMTFDNGGNSVISNSTVEINPFTTEKKVVVVDYLEVQLLP